MNGFLIAFEGIDGCGKTTLSRLVYQELLQKNYPVLLTREPGGTESGKKIRTLVHEHTFSPRAEFLLFAADRAEHIDRMVRPALMEGKIVVSDRMADSSRAYQGYGRGLDMSVVEQILAWVMHDVRPDMVVYCKIDPARAWQRIVARNEQLTPFEREKHAFYERVTLGFETIFAGRQDVFVVDATQTPTELAHQVVHELIARMKKK